MGFHPSLILRTPRCTLGGLFSSEKNVIDFFSERENEEALFIASPNLHSEFQKLRKGELKAQKEVKRLEISLNKYYNRMHTRCTPFGLFAGCSVVTWNNENDITISGNSTRVTRLDMDYVCKLVNELGNLPEIKQYLMYSPNSSLHKLGNKYRYVEYYYDKQRRKHRVSSVERSPYLERVLKKCRTPSLISEIEKEILAFDTTLKQQEITSYVNEIISSQLLVGNLEPNVVNVEYFDRLIQELTGISNIYSVPSISSILSLLTSVNNELHHLDNSVSNNIGKYRQLAEQLKQITDDVDIAKLFQVDLFRNHSNLKINSQYAEQFIKVISILAKFSQSSENSNLTRFKEKFYNRYETEEIPLLFALDTETGIGYGELLGEGVGDYTPLLDDISPIPPNRNEQLQWTKIESWKLTKLLECKEKNLKILKMTDKDVEEFNVINSFFPLSLSLSFSIASGEDNREILYLQILSRASACSLIGRFTHGLKEIYDLSESIADFDKKQHPGNVIAEICHLPEGRVGNILQRETLYDYEIPFLAKSLKEPEYQIPLHDLTIRLENNRIILWSKKLSKEVIPRLSSAHNYSFNALPVYQFLCDLQSQDFNTNIAFTWGEISHKFKFLPRVEIYDVIVSLATWHLYKSDFKLLLNSDSDKLLLDIEKWRTGFNLPKFIQLVDGENELLVNLENKIDCEMFVQTIKKREFIRLQEFLFADGKSIVKDENGNSYANEFIATVFNEDPNHKTASPISYSNKIQRDFSPGSEWLYFKLYCGVKTADEILTQKIYPLAKQLEDKRLVDKWFFIRYSDPESHLRVRFHITDLNQINHILKFINDQTKDLKDEKLIWKIQVDTYKREVERYGAAAMELSETLFWYDSISIIKMLNTIRGDYGEKIRWLLSLKSVDLLFTDFDLSQEDRINRLTNFINGFGKEFNLDKNLRAQIDKKFRDNRKEISIILDEKANIGNPELKSLLLVLHERSQRNKPIIAEIISLTPAKEQLFDRIGSYIHMNINRFFKSKQRLHELVIYYLLHKYYKSEIAKEKKNLNPGTTLIKPVLVH